MGEVAEMFDVKASLLRYWVAQFDVLQPKRNKKGNRLFTVQDVEHLKVIYHLVKERGMTLEGAKRAMKRRRGGACGTSGRCWRRCAKTSRPGARGSWRMTRRRKNVPRSRGRRACGRRRW